MQEIYRTDKSLEKKSSFNFTLKGRLDTIQGEFDAFVSYEEETNIFSLVVNQRSIGLFSIFRLDLNEGDNQIKKIANFGGKLKRIFKHFKILLIFFSIFLIF